MTVLPLFPLTLGGLGPLHACGTVRAVFRPVGFWYEVVAADGAGLHAVTVYFSRPSPGPQAASRSVCHGGFSGFGTAPDTSVSPI